jgi:hypothetical protein
MKVEMSEAPNQQLNARHASGNVRYRTEDKKEDTQQTAENVVEWAIRTMGQSVNGEYGGFAWRRGTPSGPALVSPMPRVPRRRHPLHSRQWPGTILAAAAGTTTLPAAAGTMLSPKGKTS